MEIRSGSARHLIIIGFVGALLAGCGGGGSSSSSSSSNSAPTPTADTQAPTAKINFPTDQALTTADTITITGTATDAEGNAISSVEVNGVAATSTNDFANWTASIPLTAGDNAITVATADDQGNSEARADRILIRNEVPLLNPSNIEVDSNGGRALLLDSALRAVIAVDLGTGVRSFLSDDNNGSGDTFSTPNGIAIDSANDRALVGDGTRIIAVDLATGNRTEISDLGAAEALDLAVDETNGGRLLVVTSNGVLTVPSAGGGPTAFSSAAASAGIGDPFISPESIVVDTANNRALVTDAAALVVDAAASAVIAVDLTTGDRSPIAGTFGSGSNLAAPLDITLSSDGSKALVADFGNGSRVLPMIVSIDLTTLARTVVSDGDTGTGTSFILPDAIATDSAANRSLVVDPILNAVVAVDETSGDRVSLSSADVANGAVFNGPINIEYDASNDRALVTDFNQATRSQTAIFSLDLDNGDRSILSGAGFGSGTPFDSLVDLAVGDSQVFVTDLDARSVFSVDLADGARTTLLTDSFGDSRSPLGVSLDGTTNTLYLSVIVGDTSGAAQSSELFSLSTTGTTATQVTLSGSTLRFAQNLSVDSSAGTAYVVDSKIDTTDTNPDQILAVTLAGGATASLGSIEGATSPPENELPSQNIAVVGDDIVVVDSFQGALFAIDRDTNARRDISSSERGNGVALQGPTGISYVSSRVIFLVADRSSFAIFAVEPSSGDRVIISR